MSSSDIIYTEPTLPQLLTVASFLYLLQVFRWLADLLLSAGLLGEVALGIIYGSPLAGILDENWEKTWLVVGYWGLVLIVFEGPLPSTFQGCMLLNSLNICRRSWIYAPAVYTGSSSRYRLCIYRCPVTDRVFVRHYFSRL